MSANREEVAYVNDVVGAINKEYISEVIIKKDTKKIKGVLYIEKFLKRIIDIIGGLVGIIFLIPIMVGIKIANIIAKDNGPLFYKQKRIGKDGKEFYLYKFRSMIVNADEVLFEYLAENEEAKKEYDEYKKLKNDPRVTRVGKFIRNTSLDEFPQFINVLKGDMSLVGPRPYLPREKDSMGIKYDKVILAKPGITGMWQVCGRSEVTFKERLDMDIEYHYNWSLKTDIKLLLKTVKKVLMREGAI